MVNLTFSNRLLGNFSVINDQSMTRVRWEATSPSEIRAEVEAVLESQGESERIRAFLSESTQMGDWRATVRQLCSDIISEVGPAGLTPDMIFDQVAARAHEMVPPEVRGEIRTRLESFLQTQFEDHITK
jgi:hypothetical protein